MILCYIVESDKELDSLVQRTHVSSEDIGMEFGIESALFATKKSKTVKTVSMALPDGRLPSQYRRATTINIVKY